MLENYKLVINVSKETVYVFLSVDNIYALSTYQIKK